MTSSTREREAKFFLELRAALDRSKRLTKSCLA